MGSTIEHNKIKLSDILHIFVLITWSL